MRTARNRLMPILPLLLGLVGLPAQADWQLDNQQSTLNFVSIKKVDVAETFHITRLQGSLSDTGRLQIVLDLDSVSTSIDIRDQRMRQHLFETDKFKVATLSAGLSADIMATLKQGGIMQTRVSGILDFHGLQKEIVAEIDIMSDGKTVLASTRQPIILQADSFGLAAGIDKLQEIAGLPSIGHTVPVSFSLVLN